MDINSLYNTYFDNSVNNANTDALQNTAKKNMANSSEEELMDVCKQFESYFIEQVMKEMIKTVPTSDKSNQLVDYFKDMTVQELSTKVQEQSGLGLAQTMYEQLKRNYNIQ